MIDYKVRELRDQGTRPEAEGIWLTSEEEIQISETVAEIVEKDKLNVLAYNICGDHMHLLLVCEESEVSQIVGKIKGKTSRLYHSNKGINPLVKNGAEKAVSLWTQKFGFKPIESDEQLNNTLNYIQTNRIKHELPVLKKIKSLSAKICTNTSNAFRSEYKGGFDVVIGNPPYVQLQTLGRMSDDLAKCGYETFHKGADLYCLFTERAYTLLKEGGVQSFIMPNKWMIVAYGKPLRKFLSRTCLLQVLNFGDIQFFEEATTYVCIFSIQNKKANETVKVLSLNQKMYKGDFISEVKTNLYDYKTKNFDENNWSIQPYIDACKLEKMENNGTPLKDLPILINYGIKTGYNDAFYIDEDTRKKIIATDAKSAEIIKPMVRGRDISSFGFIGGEYLINIHNGLKSKKPPLEPILIDDYPVIKEHLDVYYSKLEKRSDKGITPYNLRNCAYLEEFSKPKIIYPNMTSLFPFVYDESGILANQKCFILTAQDDSVQLRYLIAIFNSSLAKLWIWYNCPELQGGTREISKVYFENFPVPQATAEQIEILEQWAIERTELTNNSQKASLKFIKYLQSQYPIEKLPRKLQNWYNLEFGEFIKELNKAIKANKGINPLGKEKLTKMDEMDWMDVFETKKAEAQQLKAEIDKTDKEIDQMVYELYGLSDEEIRIVEMS